MDNIPDLGCTVQPKKDQTVQTGQAAWQRLTDCQTWEDWLMVGNALVTGRAEAMSTAHTNKPEGKLYNKEFGCWLETHGFAAIEKTTRFRLLECMQHRADIEAWRATLTTNQRLSFNHPGTILRRWRSKTAVRKQPDVNEVSHIAKLTPVWSQDDPAKKIARMLFSTLSPQKAGAVARELTELARITAGAKRVSAQPVSARP